MSFRKISVVELTKTNYAVKMDLKSTAVKEVASTNYIVATDVSYSMCSDLPKLRQQLKNKIPEIINDGDTLSLIWFSGKGECGTIQENISIKSAKDLSKVHSMIDKYLVPIGCTSFKDPIEETKKVISNIKKDNDNPISFIFLSDGYDNQNNWDTIETELLNLESRIESATIIEYGYYADTKRLNQMAEILGGSKINAVDFKDYEFNMDKLFKSKSSNKITLDVSEFHPLLKYKSLYTYSKKTGEVTNYQVRNGKVRIPESTKTLYGLFKESSEKFVKMTKKGDILFSSLILGLSLIDSDRWNDLDTIIPKLKINELSDSLSKAYGKQGVNDFRNKILELLKSNLNNIELSDVDYKVNKSRYCILDLLNDLSNDENSGVQLYSPLFDYSPIGAKRNPRKILSAKDRSLLSKSKSVKDAQKVLGEVKSPVFTPNKSEFYPALGLVWNKERANVSLRFDIPGVLSLPKNKFNLNNLDTKIIRNYTIIKDGILNFDDLPVTLSDKLKAKLIKKIPDSLLSLGDNSYLINLTDLPLINKSYLEKVSAKDLSTDEIESLNNKIHLKYLNYLLESRNKSKVITKSSKYSKDELEYLSSIGFSETNGYSPLTDKAESNGDFYMADYLETKIKGFSNIPSIEKVMLKLSEGKSLTKPEVLVNEVIEYFDHKKLTVKEIRSEISKLNNINRKLNYSIAKSKFSLLLGRVWFKDMKKGESAISLSGFDISYVLTKKEVKL